MGRCKQWLPRFWALYSLALVVRFLDLASAQSVPNNNSTQFEFSESTQNFTSDEIECRGSSSLTTGGRVVAMCLTPSGYQTVAVTGRCIYRDPVQLQTNDSFSTMFSFSTITGPAFFPGEGFTFFMAPDNATDGSLGGYIGWLNEANNGIQSGHNFAVEFDITQEPQFNDPDSNHVGINLNSMNSTLAVPLSQLNLTSIYTSQKMYVWIDYDGERHVLDVSMGLDDMKPCSTVISTPLDLTNILQQYMYVGFTSATGNGTVNGSKVTDAQTTIWDWSFSSTGQAFNIYGDEARCRPKLKEGPLIWGLVTGLLGVFILVLLALSIVLYRRTRRIMDLENAFEELQLLDYGPREFTYRDLLLATKKFSQHEIVGKGGFGTVYKGVVCKGEWNETTVAVKKISKASSQGIKDFVAEVKVIGRLRHVNLVPLLGWCCEKGQMLLVYEFMPHGNLQELLFPEVGPKGEEAELPWEMRLKILRGVAAALVFLHHDCEKRVVHRDIKSSNVMLDRDYNARVGDFGLARIYDRSQQHHSTNLAGTIGYLAPECVVTGNATTKSDVYSFGAMVLEVATGRRPADWRIPGEQGLVKWVWRLHDEGKILEAVDTKLGKNYDEDMMVKVMKMGLFCCLPDPEARPNMSQVQSALQSDCPILSSELPALSTLSMPLHLLDDDMSLQTHGSVTDWGSTKGSFL